MDAEPISAFEHAGAEVGQRATAWQRHRALRDQRIVKLRAPWPTRRLAKPS
jgi:hypothetical protein